MKKLLLILLLCLSATLEAQPKHRIEIYAGTGMTRLSKRIFNYFQNSSTQLRYTTLQVCPLVGMRFSTQNRTFSNLFSFDFQRSIAYSSFRSNLNNSTYINNTYSRTVIDAHYLRWDVTRGIIAWQLQIGMGPKKEIRLHGGVQLSTLLLNRSQINYWKYEETSRYDPASGTVIFTITNELKEERLRMRQMTALLCGGITLPLPQTPLSFTANWRYGFTKNDKMIGFTERGMAITLAYQL
jgi:hypothetical protein